MSPYKNQLKFPDDCPPSDEIELEELDVYRVVATFPPTDTDFLSHKELDPTKDFGKNECISHAVSVSVSLKNILNIMKLPSQKGKKVVVKISLIKDSGVFKKTCGEGHYSWWIYQNFDPVSHSVLVSN
jgi:hypothetical protein